MIKSITLHNFQSHKHTEVDFTLGVNSFVGKTDSGKSAIIRGLKWVLTNRPSGNSFVNNEVFVDDKQIEDCYVIVNTGDHIIERFKNSKKNYYMVDGERLDAGVALPDEVVEALNMNDINMQFQMDSPFLLNETSGEVARILNRVVKLDSIDTTMKQLNTYRSRLNTDKEHTAYEMESLAKEIESLECSEIEEIVELAEMLEKKLHTKEGEQEAFEKLWYDIRILMDSLKDMSKNAHRIKLLDEVVELYQKREKVAQNEHTLASLLSQVSTLGENSYNLKDIDFTVIDELLLECEATEAKVIALDALLDSVDKLMYAEPYKGIDFSLINNLIIKKEKYENNLEMLDNVLEDIVYYGNSIAEKEVEVARQNAELKDMMGDTCPLCGTSLD